MSENTSERIDELDIKRITSAGEVIDITLEELTRLNSEGPTAEFHIQSTDEKVRQEKETLERFLNVREDEIITSILPPLTGKGAERYKPGSIEHLLRVVGIVQRAIASGKYESMRISQSPGEYGALNPEGNYYIIYTPKKETRQE